MQVGEDDTWLTLRTSSNWDSKYLLLVAGRDQLGNSPLANVTDVSQIWLSFLANQEVRTSGSL